ncbi:hypothetical protein K505DRAFT_342157 [Melanomma pulvis-pyrius CBS 109.77]|uniref:Uncharacterized protein n=1 Tax=Melanomma pulvis-pyrius CBS 109.77 TaxID=1314802 RepID=A0A6A6WWT3_9PLEO|nr:hypothetical protein K505DRAFT_342157 [Melanomma pulvis-pyrius CBS 109.77]
MNSLSSENMFSALSELYSVPEKGLSKNARKRQNRKAKKQAAQEPVHMNADPAIEVSPLSDPSLASSLGHTQNETAMDSLAMSNVCRVVTAYTPKAQSWTAVATSSCSTSSTSSRKSSVSSSSSHEGSLMPKATRSTSMVKVSPQKVPVASDFPPVWYHSAPKMKESSPSSSRTKTVSVLKLRL